MVTSDPGKNVTVTCFYSEGIRDQEKKWCRGEDRSSCLATGGNETQQDRTHLKINHMHRILSVTVSKLEQNDTDWYWCASGENRIPVHISVVAENESKPKIWGDEGLERIHYTQILMLISVTDIKMPLPGGPS